MSKKETYVRPHERKNPKSRGTHRVSGHTRELSDKRPKHRPTMGGSRDPEMTDVDKWAEGLSEDEFEEYDGKYSDEEFAGGWKITEFINKKTRKTKDRDGKEYRTTYKVFKLEKGNEEIILPVRYDRRKIDGYKDGQPQFEFIPIEDEIKNSLRRRLGMPSLETLERRRKLSSGDSIRAYSRDYIENRIEEKGKDPDNYREEWLDREQKNVLMRDLFQFEDDMYEYLDLKEHLEDEDSDVMEKDNERDMRHFRRKEDALKRPITYETDVENFEEGDIGRVKIPEWLLEKKFDDDVQKMRFETLDNEIFGRVNRTTEKAVELDTQRGERWIPKSQVEEAEFFYGFKGDEEDKYVDGGN